MDIIMRPRQGGKTYEMVQLLVAEEDAVLICANSQHKESLRNLVRQVVREKYTAGGHQAASRKIDLVMSRVYVARESRNAHYNGRVLVDGIEYVLQALLGPIDVATMDMPRRAGSEYRVHFEDQRLAAAWAYEDQHRDEQQIYGTGTRTTPNTFLQASAPTPDEMVKKVAELTGASEAEVLGVALGLDKQP
jgi:hypothetical protein